MSVGGCTPARLALVATLAWCALAANASAANPIPGKSYEGPAPKAGEDVTAVVSKSGKKLVRLNFGFERGCRINGKRHPQSISIGIRNVAIKKGRFTWKRSLRYPQTGGWLKTKVTGRFVGDGTRLKGTLRERLANPSNGVRCDSGKVRFGAKVPVGELITGDWKGSTTQDRPMTMTIKGTRVTKMAFEVVLSCANGEQITRSLGTLSEPGHLSPDRGFRVSTWHEGTTIAATGKAERGLVSGTITATEYIERPDASGEPDSYECNAADVRFEARPAGGGSS